jgi:hypothetical protein
MIPAMPDQEEAAVEDSSTIKLTIEAYGTVTNPPETGNEGDCE